MTNAEANGPRIHDLAYTWFRAPDLGVMQTFSRDFGFQDPRLEKGVLLSFGTVRRSPVHICEPGDPAFLGFGALASPQDIETLAARLGTVAEETDWPIKGRRVRVVDPAGYRVDVIAPEDDHEADASTTPGWNEAGRYGRKNVRLVLPSQPSRVRRLGHVVISCPDLAASRAWYEANLGMRVSDFIVGPDGVSLIGVFLRCGLGDRPVDHHTVFLAAGPPGRLLHAAYEVRDFNDLMVGHDHLKRVGAAHEWGIGRHILGNHIFDYWSDPYGNELEHWTDGDILDESHAPGSHGVEVLLGAQWGPVHKALRSPSV